MKERIAGNIKSYRKLLSFSQLTLAEKAGISPSFLAAIETGTRNPSFETLEQIAAALGIQLDCLLQEKNDVTKSIPPEQLQMIRSKLDGITSLLLDLKDIFHELDGDEKKETIP